MMEDGFHIHEQVYFWDGKSFMICLPVDLWKGAKRIVNSAVYYPSKHRHGTSTRQVSARENGIYGRYYTPTSIQPPIKIIASSSAETLIQK